MKHNKVLLLVSILFVAIVLTACAGAAGPAGPAGPAATTADLTCTECHNDAGLVATKMAGWEVSKHGSGTAMAEEYGNPSCSYCHSGNSFRAALVAGTNFSNQEAGAVEPARQDCYACHQIHTTYTKADFAIRTEAAVALVVNTGTFDGGAGNLCVNCHQARRYMANFVDKTDATKFAATSRFNTHYSSQSDVMMGSVDVNAALGVEGKASAHMAVPDTCVGCHMGDAKNHTFTAQLSTCVTCHADATSTDVNGFSTELAGKITQLEEALLAKNLIVASAEGGYSAVAGTYDAKTAGALFTYFLYEEDGSLGVHNPGYFTALVDAAIAALQP
jgi:hypothetical protein